MSGSRSAAHIVIRRPSSAPEPDPLLRYARLIEEVGPNKHDQAIVLISALIGDGVTVGTKIVDIGKRLGLNPKYVGMTLSNGTGDNPARHGWRRDDQGGYVLLA